MGDRPYSKLTHLQCNTIAGIASKFFLDLIQCILNLCIIVGVVRGGFHSIKAVDTYFYSPGQLYPTSSKPDSCMHK
jgi:hypothetical protein